MERQELIKDISQVFTFLIRQKIRKEFRFPHGAVAERTMKSFIDRMCDRYGDELSNERLVDYCVCQIYAIDSFDENYIKRWNITHSFGKKALERFEGTHSGIKYYEDKWLNKMNLSRINLVELIKDRSKHPLFKYVYLEFEDGTKQRIPNVEARLLICRMSTMLWSPFSPVCRACEADDRCKDILQRTNPELYRLRINEFSKE